MSKSQCSTPGYIRDSLLGCYKIVLYPTAVTYDEGRHACVNDGGQLFLVNSAEKGVHLIKAISTCFFFFHSTGFYSNFKDLGVYLVNNYNDCRIGNDHIRGYTRNISFKYLQLL